MGIYLDNYQLNRVMKKSIAIIFFLVLFISLSSPFTYGEDSVEPSKEPSITPKITGERGRELKDKVKEKIQEKVKQVQQKQEERKNLLESIKEKIKEMGAKIKGELTAINGNTLTVKRDDGMMVSVDVTNAQCRRRFGAKCDWSESAVGNILNIIGKWTDSGKTAIMARLVRNTSIQKRHGVIFGKVTKKNDSSLVIESKIDGETLPVTIYTTGAKFIKRNEESMTISDIQIGHRIRAKGVWDRTLKEMRETTEIKDFDLPLIVKPSPTLTPTPTP